MNWGVAVAIVCLGERRHTAVSGGHCRGPWLPTVAAKAGPKGDGAIASSVLAAGEELSNARYGNARETKIARGSQYCAWWDGKRVAAGCPLLGSE